MPAMTVMIKPPRKLPEVAWIFLELAVAAEAGQRGEDHAHDHDGHAAEHGHSGLRGDVGRLFEQAGAFADHRQRDRHRSPQAGEDGAGQGHTDADVAHAAEHVGDAPGDGEQVGGHHAEGATSR